MPLAWLVVAFALAADMRVQVGARGDLFALMELPHEDASAKAQAAAEAHRAAADAAAKGQGGDEHAAAAAADAAAESAQDAATAADAEESAQEAKKDADAAKHAGVDASKGAKAEQHAGGEASPHEATAGEHPATSPRAVSAAEKAKWCIEDRDLVGGEMVERCDPAVVGQASQELSGCLREMSGASVLMLTSCSASGSDYLRLIETCPVCTCVEKFVKSVPDPCKVGEEKAVMDDALVSLDTEVVKTAGAKVQAICGPKVYCASHPVHASPFHKLSPWNGAAAAALALLAV